MSGEIAVSSDASGFLNDFSALSSRCEAVMQAGQAAIKEGQGAVSDNLRVVMNEYFSYAEDLKSLVDETIAFLVSASDTFAQADAEMAHAIAEIEVSKQ